MSSNQSAKKPKLSHEKLTSVNQLKTTNIIDETKLKNENVTKIVNVVTPKKKDVARHDTTEFVQDSLELLDSDFKSGISSINDLAFWSNYLCDNNVDCLLADASLKAELCKYEDPYDVRWEIRNPALFIYSSYVWEIILKTEFYSDIASPKIRKLRNSFIDDMIPYVNSGLDLVIFRQFISRLKECGLVNIEKDNFFEVPSILRILAPSYKILQKTDLKPKSYFMENCLKGLPHGVLVRPFENFKLCEIPDLKSVKLVS